MPTLSETTRPNSESCRVPPSAGTTLRLLFVLLIAFAAGVTAHAQSVRWEPGESQLGNMVQLVFDDCAPEGDPALPPIPNAALALAGTSTNNSFVNGTFTRTVTLAYYVQPRRGGGPLQIPEFTVKTNRGNIKVPAFNGAAPAISADSFASARMIPEKTTVWAGEIFGLTYELTAARRNNPQINPTFDWSPAPLVAEDWSKYEVTESVANNQRVVKLTYRSRAYGRAANAIKLEAATHMMQVQTGSTSFGGIFSQPRMEPISVTSDQPTVEIRALPPPPPGYSGAVGELQLSSKVVPGEAAVGEPITWTLELSGTANWPDITGLPAREVSKDFQVVQPKAKRTPAEGKLFEVTLTEDVVLVPTKPGTYNLGPISVTVFNPKTGQYENLRTELTRIVVKAPAASQLFNVNLGQPSADAGSGTTPAAAPGSKAAAPALPAGIPRDPLPGDYVTSVPLAAATVAWLAVLPFVVVLVLWLALAWRRARQTDPRQEERESHRRLVALLADMRREMNAASPPAPGQLLRWQREASTLWRLGHAAPTAELLENSPPAEAHALRAQAREWAALWREADRAIYAPGAVLPPDWIARAEEAAAAKPPAGFNPARLFLPRNLLPFAAAVALACFVSSSVLYAARAETSPQSMYQAGDFSGAEKAWRERLRQRPTDAVAHHNLSLSLAQQDRAGEAAAHAVVAFVQHPQHAAVRWHFAHSADKAGFAPQPLVPFLKEGPLSALAGLANPAQWQRVIVAAALLTAAGMAWLLWIAYGKRSRLRSIVALAVAGTGFVLGIAAWAGLQAYGTTADPRAVVTFRSETLRSIPTEAETTQKTAVLAPGSVAVIDRPPYLGWSHVRFNNGQTGWVRTGELVPLWR